MNPWVKRKWVKALRSGEYRQTQGALAENGPKDAGYCCLGVLVAECRPESFKVDVGRYKSYLMIKEEESDPDTAIIADDLVALWGLSRDDQERLATKNDDGDTFVEIADYIEENL